MIPNRWYAVLESNEVPARRPIGVVRLGEKLVLWREAGGRVACLSDLCPHRGAAFSIGRVAGSHVECPFHGFQFDAAGACQLIPANGRSARIGASMRVRSFPARDEHGFIWLWTGPVETELPPVPFFEDVDDSFSYATLRDPWPVHYTRAIENQLDVVHLPFVHATTIGRGGRVVVDGPLTELIGDELRIWVRNRLDDGVPPLKPQEIPIPAGPPLLMFRYPNIWQNRLGEDFRIIAAFAPVDEANTVIYVRGYQRALRAPVLRTLVDQANLLANRMILRQDKRVVATQRPVQSDLKLGEKLVQGDRPIVIYRQRLSELLAGG